MAGRKRGKSRGRRSSGSGFRGARNSQGYALPGPQRPKPRKKRDHRVRPSFAVEGPPGGRAEQDRPGIAHHLQDPAIASGNVASAAAVHSRPGNAGEKRGHGIMRLLITAAVPGRAFFAMDRPTSGLVCLGLQASLVGWLPAAVWAAYAVARVQRKQRALAGRLRPG